MQLNEPRCYHFATAAQWKAGIADRLEISDSGLQLAPGLELELLTGTSQVDSTAALAVDHCGTPYWVREQTFELVRALPEGIQVLGRLDINFDEWKPIKLVIGTHRLWLLVQSVTDDQQTRIFRYFIDTLQRLANIDIDRQILDMARDGAEGAWLLLGGDGRQAALKHLDQSGLTLNEFSLPEELTDGWIATSKEHDVLYLLDYNPKITSCDEPQAWCETFAWRIRSVDACEGKITLLFNHPCQDKVCNRDIPDFRPDLFAIDNAGRFHLLAADESTLWTFDQQGQVLAETQQLIPGYLLPIKALLANDRLLVSSAAGIGEFRQTESVHPSTPEAVPTYISPVMVSPEGVQPGWMRADLRVNFSRGSAIEISAASSNDPLLIEEVTGLFANTRLLPMARLQRIDARLPWADESTIVYQGSDWPVGQALRFPLQEIDNTHLWLRIRIHTEQGAQPPTLDSMRVYYPDISYTRYLPAVYQESKQGAKTLRRLLSVFESLFGDLDAQLAELPTRIDPKTAPDDWLPYLLSWLGLPAPTELAPDEQRKLLIAAPALLRERGTKGALAKLLALLTGEHSDFTINDNSAGPVPWTLPVEDSNAYQPRLGCDTLVLDPKPPGFYLGQSSILGSQALGYGTIDPTSLYAITSGLITIRIAVPATERERLEPLLHRYLRYFIPAHCRYTLQFVAVNKLHKYPLLDSELRLQRQQPPRLGEDTIAGRMRLEAGKGGGINLGHSTLLDDGPYLL